MQFYSFFAFKVSAQKLKLQYKFHEAVKFQTDNILVRNEKIMSKCQKTCY